MSGNDDKIESGYVGVQDPDVLVNLEPAKPYQVKSPLLRECIAEFLGTMVMIMFGDGVVAQVVLSEGTKGECRVLSNAAGLLHLAANRITASRS
ncbi:hypothetical protein PF005_g1232 [Phytophthora fragariae]|uniref:Uncharacterized protein n=1 Tax=Phytophthora fragariae TaxID=53985 RepID=A0A6A3ZFY3_9STRA|nr:hypothetical protein PF006_g4908 [Phytophthora fragariae]KAE9236032.1 hypothetical protein PF005_g1232 [Phytophthora fragariae]KAE9353562.1 hypothetical protein PF008_g4942 [Phytophthora fragariae]